jgi:hypothetical protein
MAHARRHGATRNALAAAVALLALLPVPTCAESGPDLLLPLVTAIAVASAASKTPTTVGFDRSGRSILSLLPPELRIQDGYDIDMNDYIGRRSPNAVVDINRLVAYDVLRRRQNGWMLSLAYDTERKGPLSDTGEVLRFVLDYRF